MNLQDVIDDFSNSDRNEDIVEQMWRWDGPWSYAGLHCMMEELDSEDFLLIQYEDFFDEKRVDPSLNEKEEFVSFPDDYASVEDHELFAESLFKRNLKITSGLLQRYVEGIAPVQIRIRRLDEEAELKPMMKLKQQGNKMFGKKKYENAIDLYDEAVLRVRDMYIGPSDQIEQIATILSNKAECELQLGRYEDAGNTATEAILFMKQEKSLIRRAKAGLAAATQQESRSVKLEYLRCARKDCEYVLDPKTIYTSVAIQTSKNLLSKIELAMNSALDADIESLFAIDSATLTPDSRHLLESRSLADLYKDPILSKMDWIRLVRLSRNSEAEFMHRWLGLSSSVRAPMSKIPDGYWPSRETTAEAELMHRWLGLPAPPPASHEQYRAGEWFQP